MIKKSKQKATFLALFLGNFGAHCFYLNNKKSGIIRLILGILFLPFSVIIPGIFIQLALFSIEGQFDSDFFLITLIWLPLSFSNIWGLIDFVKLLRMSDETFDLKYNQPEKLVEKTIKKCFGCNKALKFANTPLLKRWNTLKTGESICINCFHKILKTPHLARQNSWTTQDLNEALQKKVMEETEKPFLAKKYNLKWHNTLLKLDNEYQKVFQDILKDFVFINDFRQKYEKLSPITSQWIENLMVYDFLKITLNTCPNYEQNSYTTMYILSSIFTNHKSDHKNYIEAKALFVKPFESKALSQNYYNIIHNPIIQVKYADNTPAVFPFLTALSVFKSNHFANYQQLLEQYLLLLKEIVTENYHLGIEKQLQQLKKPNEVLNENPPSETIDSDWKGELYSLIGLQSVKNEVITLSNFIKVQKARENAQMISIPINYHMVFTGNPGTGKTTVARLMAKMYKELGILSKGHLVETDRSGLVAEYSGQTGPKVNAVIDKALGGVLFIDEAYAISGNKSDLFGQEAIATLLKRIEDDRANFIVIMAGYQKEMDFFIEQNPGFRSRFNKYIHFDDYSVFDLYNIFEMLLTKHQLVITPEAQEKVKTHLENIFLLRDEHFGNARFVRNVFETVLQNQSNRIAKEDLTPESLSSITSQDIFFNT